MALTDLADLKSEMKEWAADRPDLIPRFQDCIDLTTNDLNKIIRGPKQQASYVFVPDEDGSAPLPEDYLEWRAVTALTNPVTDLKPLSPEGATDIYPNKYGGFPSHFLLAGDSITVMPNTENQIELLYWKRIPHLTEAEPVNWVLTDNANVYLFGAMKYVEVFKRNTEGAQMFGGMYTGLIDAMVRETKRHQWSRMRARVAGRSTP